MTAVDKAWFETRPKGSVIKVTPADGERFWLIAEGGAFRDFTLHEGKPAFGLEGRHARYGAARQFWSADMLARWVAEGRCRVELAEPERGAR